MNIHSFKWLMAGVLMMAGLAGCGGSSSSNPAPQPVGDSTVIKGTASAGIIYPGTVNVYEVKADGTKGALLAGSVPTDINGKYTASLGSYSGAIQVETSGTYTDETTGVLVTIPASKPLHALVDSVNNSTKNNRTVSVTPLTDVAWRTASSTGTAPTTPATITANNKLVDDLFKVSDIIGTEPVRPTNADMANASPEAQGYTLALVALSKMSSTATGSTGSEKLDSVLTKMETEVKSAETSGSMSAGTTSDFSSALTSASLSTDFPSASEQLLSMGKKSQKLTLATSGTLPTGTKIYAIEGTINLPVDATNKLKVSLRADSAGKTLSDVLLLAGVAAGMEGADPLASYQPLQQQVSFTVFLNVSGTGIAVGDFATLAYDVASGATVSAADFSIATAFAKDANGADISGVTVIIK